MSTGKEDCLCDRIAEVLPRHGRERGELIPILQDMQDAIGYLPPDAIRAVAEFLNVAESVVYGVVTFYSQFYLTRQGRHRVKVCEGTACHVRGSGDVRTAIERTLGVGSGSTTEDYRFSLERVACFGSCALAPVMVVDDRVYGNVTPEQAVEILEDYP